MMESYKTKEKESLLGNLEEKKVEVANQPARQVTDKAVNKGIAI